MPAPRHFVDVMEPRTLTGHLHPKVEVLTAASHPCEWGWEVALLGNLIPYKRRDWKGVRRRGIPLLPTVARDWVRTADDVEPRPDDICARLDLSSNQHLEVAGQQLVVIINERDPVRSSLSQSPRSGRSSAFLQVVQRYRERRRRVSLSGH